MTINNVLRIILIVLSAASLIAVFIVDTTGLKFLFIGLSVSTFTASFNNRNVRYAGGGVGLVLLLVAIYFLNFAPDDSKKGGISIDPFTIVKDSVAL